MSELESNINYDDICGPWKLDSVPLDSPCNLSFKLITPEDVTYMRKQKDQKSILLFLEKKFLADILYKEENKEILVKFLWQIFRFFKKNLFTDEQIATVMS
ncbi:PREDICTED: uncharacterized protein LOC108760414 [Trachymyrmex cornetzi]|uniref:uncharacterized protein LOC108760414 n=1 Tax=Trachymyrmex cornetzi TaxID=471704 RepID=UPI00084F1379|nr:PREDICTED: uncharacterized protein LOC108760414 [Trachymyrmex cornetzi]